MGNQEVLYERDGTTALITINRPEVRNSLNGAVFLQLNDILDQVGKDEHVRALIIAGVGNTFVSGADIHELLGFDTTTGWSSSRFHQSVFNKLERVGKPSIAAVNGFALGGGLELALSCTFRVASVNAKLGFPELGLGIIPAFGGTQRLVRCVGQAKAAEMILFHSIIDGEAAHRIGLVNHLVEPDQVLPKAREMSEALCALSPLAVRLELELLLEAEKSGFNVGLALESALGSVAVSSTEAKHLLERFLTKGRSTSRR
ncbi:MAG: enoyl-CoA hydratase/isomerase family protein [Deltaproteobacteria bacterium]|nr:enoyl-CoA hydratase/isomerase family protein [Deltaproteobacteria bacterium]